MKVQSIEEFKKQNKAVSMKQMQDYVTTLLGPLLQLGARHDSMLTYMFEWLGGDGLEVWKDREFINGVPTGGTFMGRAYLDVDAFSAYTKQRAQEDNEAAANGK